LLTAPMTRECFCTLAWKRGEVLVLLRRDDVTVEIEFSGQTNLLPPAAWSQEFVVRQGRGRRERSTLPASRLRWDKNCSESPRTRLNQPQNKYYFEQDVFCNVVTNLPTIPIQYLSGCSNLVLRKLWAPKMLWSPVELDNERL
jgi:hypothetical protein